MSNMLKYYRQLLEACEETGIKMLSDDYCCQLLAVVDVFGNEDMVFQGMFAEDIKVAQKRANIFGGVVPNAELAAKVKYYIDELNEALHEAHEEILNDKSSKDIEWSFVSKMMPEWAQTIEARYKTKFVR